MTRAPHLAGPFSAAEAITIDTPRREVLLTILVFCLVAYLAITRRDVQSAGPGALRVSDEARMMPAMQPHREETPMATSTHEQGHPAQRDPMRHYKHFQDSEHGSSQQRP
jgi:hypothetical protein